MKLYYSTGACSLTDHIVLEWIGKPYETQKVSREERAAPAFKKINPAGAVPVLENDGWVLTQNVAILNYLADSFPEAKLGGDGTPKSRAEINRWLAFVNSDMHPAFKPLFGSLAYLEDEAVIARAKANAKTTLRALFERANAQLAGRDWIAGSRSIADPYLYVTLRWAKGQEVDLSGLDNLAGFVARMEADAAVQKVLKDEGLS
jgi:glutathione S-transferase